MTAGHDSTFRTIGPSVEVPHRLCVHNVCQHAKSRRRQVRLSRQASAPALTLSHAASSMPGQCGSSSAKRCEHVEVTFSGWTCILRQGLEPALTRQSWLRALCFTALCGYFRSRPRTLAIKTRPGGPYRGWGGYEGVDGRPSVLRRGEGVKVLPLGIAYISPPSPVPAWACMRTILSPTRQQSKPV